jgi:cell wall assembly regulator SMI1
MEDLLQRLDAALRQQRPEYYSTLLPGANPEEIAQLERTLRWPVPDDLRALLAWKNGHPRKELSVGYVYTGDPLWGKYTLMSIQEIIPSCEDMREMLEGEEWDYPDWWHTGYIPFATDMGGDYLLIDMAATLSGHPGQIMDWAHAAPLRQILCASLRSFVEAVVIALESGLGDPEEDGVQYEAILKQRNPGYPIRHILKEPSDSS